MILYGIDNIRDLFGHKVSILVLCAVSLAVFYIRLVLMLAGQSKPDPKEPTVSVGVIGWEQFQHHWQFVLST